MTIFRIQWTEDGQERETAVTDDVTRAQECVTELEAREGVTNVRRVPVKPGEGA
ncbi:hypothetical protein [Streptomyces sp. NPDC002324]